MLTPTSLDPTRAYGAVELHSLEDGTTIMTKDTYGGDDFEYSLEDVDDKLK